MELHFGSRASRDRISIDWTLIAISVFAAALILGTMIRTAPDPLPGSPTQAGGLHVLNDNQRLVSFEDFSFGANGWRSAGRGAGTDSVLGPFDTGTVAKSYALPQDASRAEVAFDLRALGGWSGEGLSVLVNGREVVGNIAQTPATPHVVIRRAAPRSNAGTDYRVWIAVDQPGDALSLEFDAAPADGAWAVDNVSVVAVGPTS